MKGLFLKLSSVKNISSLKSKAQGCNSFSFISTADIIAEINIHIYFSAASLSSERVVLTKGMRGYQGLVLDLNLWTTQSTQPHSSPSFPGFSLSCARGTREGVFLWERGCVSILGSWLLSSQLFWFLIHIACSDTDTSSHVWVQKERIFSFGTANLLIAVNTGRSPG